MTMSRRALVQGQVEGLEPINRRAELPPAKPARYETEVIVARPGEVVLPVDLLVRFENGEQVRETWDGRATWKRFTYEKEARASSAMLDPEDLYAMDLDRNNNSLSLEPHRAAIAPLALHWLFWVQNDLHLASSLL